MRKVLSVFCLLGLSLYLILGFNAFAQPPNIQVNQVDHTTGTLDNSTVQSETSHAVFGSTIVVGWNDTSQFATTGLGGLTSLQGYAYSTDGGATFTDAGLLAPAPGTVNVSDPALAVDNAGNFYFATLAGPGLSTSFVAVAQSTSISPAVTFGTPVLIPGLLTTGLQDKEFIAVDTSGGPFGGRVYVAWSEFANIFDSTPKILFARSTSTSPLAFATPIPLSPTDALNQGAMPAVGPDGELYVVWGRFILPTAQSIRLVKSTNGGVTFSNPDPADLAPNKIVATSIPAVGNMVSGGINIRTRGFPYIAVDRTPVGSPTRGNVYIVFQADPDAAGAVVGPDRSDIFFTRSTDGGATWSTPRSINTAPAVTLNPDTTTNDNWQPFIAVSPGNGHIAVTFYDRRNDPANTKITLFKAVSTDAGLTWGNEPVSTVAFTPATGYDPLAASTYMGDYNYAVADGSAFHMTWGDTRNTCTPPAGPTSPCSPAGRPDQDVFYAKEPIISVAFEYAAKVVCGLQKDPKEMRLARGFYATAINIHNPNDSEVRFSKKLALTFPPKEQKPGKVISIGKDVLGPDEALEVDCTDIRRKVFPNGFPTPYIKGFVVIESSASLDVTAVYTAAKPGGFLSRRKVTSIDVEQIRERRIKKVEKLPDLVVKDIDLNTLDVDCPGGPGTCVTKVTFTIANIGAGNAGAFNIRIAFDPAQSVVVNQSVTGLAAGAAQSFTVTTPPGGNCFDPDCTVCVTVDSGNTVTESNEGNNQLCKIKLG